jgi:UDP-3-O-acyl N-acetylglucosamine deacetylase
MNQCCSSADNSSCATEKPLILVVDDDAGIRKSLAAILTDEGYRVEAASSGAGALEFAAAEVPDLVLLDIWMPGMDGLESLSKLKAAHPELPVVMISGHATIATAISATKLGAVDFIEKPLDIERTLDAIRKNLVENIGCVSSQPSAAFEESEKGSSSSEGAASTNPVAFADQFSRGAELTQRTLRRSAVIYGQGLHSGRKSGLILEPLPAGSGIHFVGVSETTAVPAHLDYVESTGFATTVRLAATQVGTIEHLMSALHAYSISNLLIKCNGEVPVMDGSSQEFCRLIEDSGIEEQGKGWYELAVDRVIQVGDDREYIKIEPAEGFIIDYTLTYPAPLGEQRMVFKLDSIDSYKREIAPARTFGFVRDIGALQRQGLALGGRFDNFVLFGSEGPINDSLRFADEPVRHKILDAIGDLYLLGRPLRGRVTARMTGHSDNIELLTAIRRELSKVSQA